MLRIFTSLRNIRFGELMEVYRDSNKESASDWPGLPMGYALALAEQDFRQYLLEGFFPTPGAVCAAWEENGKYISALRLEPYKDGVLLEGLETHPDHRRKGYAAMLISAVQQHLGAVKIYSHVNKRNTASMKTHEKCGFKQISDHAVYINGNVDYRCCTLLYEA